MLKQIRPALVFIILMTVLTGIAYPLGITGIAQLTFPHRANGSLIMRDHKVIGSEFIGQSFTSGKYFHGRPSATAPVPYNAANSGGSNLGPTSKTLIDGVKAEAEKLRAQSNRLIPVDLVTASGSGLDPDITPAAAEFQIARVAKARNLSESEVKTLVDRLTDSRTFGFIGEPHVNVLKLNLALDDLKQGPAR